MRGGLLQVSGNAGHLLGAAYRGSPKGMRGGTIVVAGAAGNEVGCAMRRGLIAVGAAGDFAGVMMLAGSIFVLGRLGIRPAAGMKRGTLVTVARPGDGPRLLPTFRYDCEYRPPWLPLYVRRLRALGVSVPDGLAGPARRYSGDFTELGKGEILVWTSA
jgi:formylmethanofuran dehydrogenase subunit C